MARCFPTSLFLFSGDPARDRHDSPNRRNIFIRVPVSVDTSRRVSTCSRDRRCSCKKDASVSGETPRSRYEEYMFVNNFEDN